MFTIVNNPKIQNLDSTNAENSCTEGVAPSLGISDGIGCPGGTLNVNCWHKVVMNIKRLARP